MSATFVEEKRITLLKEPLRNEGRIFYKRPGMFARFVDKPFESKVLLRDARLSLTEGATTRVIELNSQPAVRALVGGFLSLLQADAAALTRDYQISFEPHDDGTWQVVLTPKGAPIDKLLRELSFTGAGGKLGTMRWVERSGDISETRFSNVKLDRSFSEAEVAEYFAPSAK